MSSRDKGALFGILGVLSSWCGTVPKSMGKVLERKETTRPPDGAHDRPGGLDPGHRWRCEGGPARGRRVADHWPLDLAAAVGGGDWDQERARPLGSSVPCASPASSSSARAVWMVRAFKGWPASASRSPSWRVVCIGPPASSAASTHRRDADSSPPGSLVGVSSGRTSAAYSSEL